MTLNEELIGKKFNSYPKLCKALGVSKRTNSERRKAHIRDIERYVKLKIKNNTYTILEIYDTPLAKVDGRVNNKGGNNTQKIDIAEQILIHMLAQVDFIGEESVKTLSKGELYKALGYTNDNYTVANGERDITSEILGVSDYATYYYFTRMYDNARSRVDSLLKRITRRKYMKYQIVLNVCTLNGEHRQATDEEFTKIAEIERCCLRQLGCEDMVDVYDNGKYGQYRELSNELMWNVGLRYSYECYKFALTKDYNSIIERDYKLQLENGETIQSLREQMNNLIKIGNEDSFNKRHKKAINNTPAVGIHKNKGDRIASSSEFTEHGRVLFEVCGDIKTNRDLGKEIAIAKKNKIENKDS